MEKRKFSVYMVADAGMTVDVEIDVPAGATNEEIASLAYEAASEEADLHQCEIADWTGQFEVVAESSSGGINIVYSDL